MILQGYSGAGHSSWFRQRNVHWRWTALAAFAALAPLGAVRLAAQNVAIAPAPLAQAESSPVKANLNITPKRLTFSRGERSRTVYIYNQGTTPAVFDISMVDRVMLPTGEIEPLSQAEKQPELAPILSHVASAKDMVIATPRRASLAPGKGQTIRILVTAPAGSGAPEYRSHLTVTTVPPRDVGVTAEEAAAAARSNRFSFNVTPTFGISIPVIVRSGTLDVRGAISDVHFAYANMSPDGVAPARRTPTLSFALQRTGANSLFGNIEVRAKNKGLLGLARGVGVYTEIDQRIIRIPLQRVLTAGEQLEITFIDDDTNPGHIIARTAFVVS